MTKDFETFRMQKNHLKIENNTLDRTYLIDEKGIVFLPSDAGVKEITMTLKPHSYPKKVLFYNKETSCYEFVGECMANGHSRTNDLQLSEKQVLENKVFTFEQ